MLLARIFRGGCRGREPAFIRKVSNSCYPVSAQKRCRDVFLKRKATYERDFNDLSLPSLEAKVYFLVLSNSDST